MLSRASHMGNGHALIRSLGVNFDGRVVTHGIDAAFGDAAGDLMKSLRSTHRRDVFLKNLIGGGRGRGCGGGFRVVRGLRIAGDDRRRSYGIVTAAMARIASHFLAAIEAVLIDRERHGDHLARGLLRGFVIGFKLVLAHGRIRTPRPGTRP